MTRPTARRVALYAVLAVWSVICLFPPLWLAVTSLKDVDAMLHGPVYLPFVDFTPTLEAWRYIFTDHNEGVLRPLVNTLVVSIAATAMSLLAGVLFLYATSRLGRPAPRWMALILASRIVPPAVLVVPHFLLLMHLGLADSRTGLAFIYAAVNLPVTLWLLWPVMGTRASEQEEAARLDGAGHALILYDILLPMIWPALAATGLLVFVLSWNEYLLAASLTGSNASTLTPWMMGLLSMKEAQVGGELEEGPRFAAAALFLILPLLLATRQVIRSLSATASRR